MLFSKFNDNDVRGFCREAIETLEYRLRQIVDEEFKNKLGENYVNATNVNGDRVIKKEIAEGIN